MKKITISLAITMAMLFGGTFTNHTADAAQINHHVKVYYNVNGEWQSIKADKLSNFINRYFNKWHKIDWQTLVEKQAKNNPEQPQQEQPKVEQPKQEEPKQEQPKVEQPKQEVPKQEQPKVEQPKQEAPPVEQPRQEQPQQTENTNQAQYQLNQFEQQVVELTNQERAKNGLSPLKIDSDLSRVARHKSLDLAQNNYFDHNSPTYGSPFDMMKAYGISYRTAGENIAKGQRTPQEVVNAWMNSPGHRANILNGNYTHIGVGYIEQGNHWTQMFIGK